MDMAERFPENVPKEPGPLLIVGLRGLGDNIHQRAFVRDLKRPIYLNTPWPELYQDLPHVSFVPCRTYLRTQIKNIQRQSPDRFKDAPYGCKIVNISYNENDLIVGSAFSRIGQLFGGVHPTYLDLPKFEAPELHDISILLGQGKRYYDQPTAIIRPPTVRREWMNISRNPKSCYISEAAGLLQQAGYYVISICDLTEEDEWLAGPPPPADLYLHKGELNVTELLGLVQASSALVGGVGFLLSAALATGKPMLLVAGGYGGQNDVKQVADPAYCDGSKVTWIYPDYFCQCIDMLHPCNKNISNFTEKAQTWIKNIN